MNSTREKAKGTLNAAVGKAKQTAGKVFNDRNLETKGAVQKNIGKGERTVGKIEEKIKKNSQSFGDRIKKASQNLKTNAMKAGASMEKTGNKIKHMTD